MPGRRWYRTLTGALAALALLAAAAPAVAAQDASARPAASLPDDLWASPPAREGTVGSSGEGGGWSFPLLALALAVAYAGGLLVGVAPGLLPSSTAPGQAAWPQPGRAPDAPTPPSED